MKKLNQNTSKTAWNEINERFNFENRTISSSRLPGLILNIGFTYDLDYPEKWLRKFKDVGQEIIKRITPPGASIFALDLFHQDYEIDPENYFKQSYYRISVWPEGDYYVFMTRDFSNIWYGGPRGKIYIYGHEIVKATSEFISELKEIKILIGTPDFKTKL